LILDLEEKINVDSRFRGNDDSLEVGPSSARLLAPGRISPPVTL